MMNDQELDRKQNELWVNALKTIGELETDLEKAQALITKLEAQLTEVRAEYQKVTVLLAQSNQLQDEYKAQLADITDLTEDDEDE